ncbi:MAG: oxidoreductase-like domain-containing protein [Methylococcales bacterium]
MEPQIAFGEISLELPPRPIQPVPGECCERGCENCVWVHYERALKRWEDRCAEIRSSAG